MSTLKRYCLCICAVSFLAINVISQNEIIIKEKQSYLDTMHKYITSEKLFNYVKQFSDDSLEGRLVGTKGMEKANKIMSRYFSMFGLLPINNGSYIQEFPHPIVEIQPGCIFELFFPIKSKSDSWLKKEYTWGKGWYAGSLSGNGDITAEIVYAGYGITAPELNYDDYKDIDVKGKIVLIEGETPNKSNKTEDINKWLKYSLHETKFANAIKHGALGLLFKWVPTPNAPYHSDLVYCHITKNVVTDIFSVKGRFYDETITKISKTKKANSFSTGVKARIKMVSTYNPDSKGKNIVGLIPGNDSILKDEYIIVSAHLDHLGKIPYIIPGANDNSSSSSVLLGVAEALSKASVKTKRSILFISFDGEEAGLTGSLYYTQNPLIPKESVVAVFNLEQVGVGNHLQANYAYNYPEINKYLIKANNLFVHRRLSTYKNYYRKRPRTDGAIFMKAGYPCADLRASNAIYYHTPQDNIESINPEILQSVAQWLYWSIILIDNK